ncbi:MAG: hypothetical protein OXG79_09340 [Chloroflexi bacterium]|nr:hypothetical protein [Chloroflexota bacterium]
MIRRLNSTGRRTVKREHAKVSLRPAENGAPSIHDMQLDLAGYGFPPDARVRVEAWRSNAVQRWDYGTVGALTPPSAEQRRMTEVPESSQFRVLVVAGDGSGRLLGHMPSIKPVLPLRSLLPVREVDEDELGGEIWRVDFGDGDLPELWVNRAVGGISEFVRTNKDFRALVMPAVLRVILTRILIDERADPEDGESAWEGWFRLASNLLPDADVPRIESNGEANDLSEARSWIDSVVGAFARDRVFAVGAYSKPWDY